MRCDTLYSFFVLLTHPVVFSIALLLCSRPLGGTDMLHVRNGRKKGEEEKVKEMFCYYSRLSVSCTIILQYNTPLSDLFVVYVCSLFILII